MGNHAVSGAGKPLAGQTAVVTGAGSGAGAAIARALAGAGARVCVSDLNPDRADRVTEAITAAGGEAFAFQADISNKFQVAALIEETRDRGGRLDILVHNAHIRPEVGILKMDEWSWRRTLEVNLTGAFFCAQLAGRVMADEGGGLIVLLSRPGQAGAYTAFNTTQRSVEALAAQLAGELSPQGVRVVPVAAGPDDQLTAGRVLTLCAGDSP